MKVKFINGHVQVLVVDDGTIKTARELVGSIIKAENRLAELESLNKKLTAFFKSGIEFSFDGCDFDGGEMQFLALKLGLIVETKAPDGSDDIWYEIAPEVE